MGEPIDIFIIVLSGQLRIGKQSVLTTKQQNEGLKIIYLNTADMVGFQNLCEMSGAFQDEKWKFDVFAETETLMGILPYGEIKTEIRRQPQGMLKLLQLASLKAYETTYFNITGMNLNNAIQFTHQPITLKKVRDLQKNPIFKSFLNGLEQKDLRIFISDIKSQQFYSGDRVIRKGTKDRSLFIIVTGSFFCI